MPQTPNNLTLPSFETRLELLGHDGKRKTVILSGGAAAGTFGGSGSNGEIEIRNQAGDTTVRIIGEHGNIDLGGNGADGDVTVRSQTGKTTAHIDGERGSISLGGNGKTTAHIDGEHGALTLGGNGINGDIYAKNSLGAVTAHIVGEHGNIELGGNGTDGDLIVRSQTGKTTAHIDGEHGALTLGGNGINGDVYAKNSLGSVTVRIAGEHGNVELGGHGTDGDIVVMNKSGATTIHIDGDAGDVLVSGADCAEYFQAADHDAIAPGTVLSINDDGLLAPCTTAYSRRVAGVVSGAGGLHPGVRLGALGRGHDTVPIALVGRVYCMADAGHGAIRIGDLLTTSTTPGAAMRAEQSTLAFGSILGKALQPLSRGCGLILILVSLQ